MGCGASSDPSPTPPAYPAPAFPAVPASSSTESPRDRRNSKDRGGSGQGLRACKYGVECYQRNMAHLKKFAHPGDRNYRFGHVSFGPGQKPTFQTMWQLFNFYDPEESGYLEKDDFGSVYGFLDNQTEHGVELPGLDNSWESSNQNGHLNFSRLIVWSEAFDFGLPVGVNDVNEQRPCRFKSGGGERCSCPNFEPAEDGFLCKCGHKPSVHRSDAAEASAGGLRTAPQWWAEDRQGFVEIDDAELIEQVQELLSKTHKKEDNWTRDRGCSIHGRHDEGCTFGCAFRNQVPVPRQYTVRKVLRNQNIDLWTKYSMMRNSIADECAREAEKYTDVAVESTADLDSPLVAGANEWRLFHGTKLAACRGISNSNFRLSLAGTGATWKDPGKEKGSPLYGFGIYLAERITKADEYSEKVTPDELSDLLGAESAEGISDVEIYCILIVRCVGGRTNVVTTNDINKEQLKNDVFDGPHHSVFGDRVASLGKPYKEIVVYDKDQCYPEFLILYERSYP